MTMNDNKQTMRSIRIDHYGDENVMHLVEESISNPSLNEILIHVKSAGVNPVDWKIREGAGERFGMKLPIYLGSEISGIVEKVGSEILGFRSGDEVYGTIKAGGYADFVIVKPEEIAIKPKNIDFNAAAGVPLGALTAWQAMFDVANLGNGQRVLITAASGGVGSLAVQIAKSRGCYVVGLASGRNEDFVKSLGADEFINYQETAFENVIKDMDVVFDLVGGDTFEKSVQCLKPGGFLVTAVAFPDKDLQEKKNIKFARVVSKPNPDQLNKISKLVEEEKLIPTVTSVFSLDDVKAAHRLSKSGHSKGKIVLEVNK